MNDITNKNSEHEIISNPLIESINFNTKSEFLLNIPSQTNSSKSSASNKSNESDKNNTNNINNINNIPKKIPPLLNKNKSKLIIII